MDFCVFSSYPFPYLAVCTSVISSSVPPFAFFGQQERVYVQMYAEPQPSSHSPQVYLVEDSGNFTLVDLLEVDILRNTSVPLLTWVYLLNIPDIPSADSATLEFFATYSTADERCLDVRRSVQLNVPVVRSESGQSAPVFPLSLHPSPSILLPSSLYLHPSTSIPLPPSLSLHPSPSPSPSIPLVLPCEGHPLVVYCWTVD